MSEEKSCENCQHPTCSGVSLKYTDGLACNGFGYVGQPIVKEGEEVKSELKSKIQDLKREIEK